MTFIITALSESASAPDPGNGGTIATSSVGEARVSPAGASRIGCILQAGTLAAQEVWIVNEHASNTISWATQATSNIAGESGGTFVLGGNSAQKFVWDSTQSLWYIFLHAPIVNASAVSLASSGTISATGLDISRVTTSGAVTGVILQVGTYSGQGVVVSNESANSITFDVSGTSHVAAGTGAVISANTSRRFVWTGSLWY